MYINLSHTSAVATDRPDRSMMERETHTHTNTERERERERERPLVYNIIKLKLEGETGSERTLVRGTVGIFRRGELAWKLWYSWP